MFVNFSDIPGSQNLFLDYLHEFENVNIFFSKNFRDIDSYADHFKELSTNEKCNRQNLIEILKNQYKDYKVSKQTEINISLFESKRTLAVVTGQQLGLFSGPLYTLYKTITAIKLAAWLKENFEGYNFVPVFWLEGDDHDFDEIRSVNIIANDNSVKKLTYNKEIEEGLNRGPVSSLKLNESFNELLNELKDNLRETEFTKELFSLIENCYYTGANFNTSMKKLLIHLFDEYGLVILDPTDKKVKESLMPIFENEITSFPKSSALLVERSAELEELYHAQVKVKPINLFYNDGNERLLIEPVEDEFRLKGKRKKFSKEEILNEIENHPEKFSPNVLLRPICQDTLLPTAFYVAGPSEISYFAQVSPLYELNNLVQPIIYPRSSAVIVEKQFSNLLSKYNLNYQDLFREESSLNEKVLSKISDFASSHLFNNIEKTYKEEFDQLNSRIEIIDKNLTVVSEKTLSKILQLLNNLKDKTREAEIRKHDVAIKQLQKMRNNLYPLDNLQERELSFIHFSNKYGIDFIKFLFIQLQINKFEHQVIEI
ncbi:MAG: bacillithiol biosynthesis cysteine-adding enzyme BshC [Melioribacteraceae bacterium]|nr:bacillithiol biosynthesis cysteine-adding enzyme BshC [Melioribacteraceae bacterium]